MNVEIRVLAAKDDGSRKVLLKKITDLSYFNDLPPLARGWHYRLEYYPEGDS